MAFDRRTVDQFRLTSYDWDPTAGVAALRYALDDLHSFEEHVEFGPGQMANSDAVGSERVIRLLHLASGVSYYKTAAPRRIVVETGPLSRTEEKFVSDLYDKGMREFSYHNGIEIPRALEIECVRSAADGGLLAVRPRPGVAVPIGGGKDSIVVLEALRVMNPVLVCVNPNAAVRRTAEISGLELKEVQRHLDPLLFRLNEQGALNGHVPVTAVVSLICLAGCYVYGYDTVAMALESSADEPTRVLSESNGEVEINHQWSKSGEFEVELQQVLRESVDSSIIYVSPLRSFGELEITAAFASLRAYHRAFRSCNRVSKLTGGADEWCCDCPKCRFVFLALAANLDRRSVVSIFGSDLMADEGQVQGFFDLRDPERKPFECVGSIDEVDSAFVHLMDDPEWSGAVVVEKMRSVLDRHGVDQTQRGDASGGARAVESSPETVMEEVRRAVSRARTR